jgi:17beta-estradiol 17-dehydrogenase / very-long-chain 3-oxoacyl-CoA reductase
METLKSLFFPTSQQVLQSVPQLAQNVVIFIGSYIIGARAYGAITRFINSRFRQPKLRSLGRWAVVTGGSDGIGLAYATELARHNMSIAIIARSLTKLQAAKESIRRAVPNADVEIITADFSQRDCVAKLRGELFLKIAPDEIGVLINNVGTNTPALYFDPLESNIHANGSRETLNNVNVVAATEMTALVMTYMVAKGKGLIVNVSSGFGRIPSGAPFYAQYSASKAYIDFFSRSLHYEVKPLGVHVQCQVPYLVATELAGVKKTSLFVPSPETYAKAAVADFFSGPVSVPYWPHAIEDSLASLLPVQFVAGQIYKLNANTRERYCTKQKRLADIAVERAMNALRGNEISDGESKKSNGGGGGGGGGAGAERGISRSKRSGGKN